MSKFFRKKKKEIYIDKSSTSKSKAKKAAAVALAAAIAAGAATMPAEGSDISNAQVPDPIVQDIDSMNASYSSAADDDHSHIQEKKSVRSTIARILAVPIYAVGGLLMKLLDIFAGNVLAPFLLMVIKWALLIGVIIGSIALCCKIAFPDLPLGKILNKKCLFFIACSVTCGSIICEVLPVFWDEAGPWVLLIRLMFGLAVFVPIIITVMKFFGKRRAVSSVK